MLWGMGVGSRVFVTFLCDGCGREVIAEEGATVDGYMLEALHTFRGQRVSSENIFACSDICVERAIRDGLKRASMPEEQRTSATEELWLRGRQFRTNPGIPILDMSDETRQIGTAEEIANYRPSPRPLEK